MQPSPLISIRVAVFGLRTDGALENEHGIGECHNRNHEEEKKRPVPPFLNIYVASVGSTRQNLV